MEPTLPAPNLDPERAPVDYGQNHEQIPQVQSPERAFEQSPEHLELTSETTPVVISDTSVLPTPVVLPMPSPLADPVISTHDATDAPAIAADDDVIEKEWVDKAKKIISETKDDPHTRERKVAELQVDYLRKRYGKELGSVDV